MSRLRRNGDDHPEAAHKHLLDAQTLLGQRRADGAAYLSGYVVECALKSLWLHETGIPMGSPMPWGKKHDISFLAKQVSALAAVAGAKTARYFKQATSSVSSSAIAVWKPEMRYWAEKTMTYGDAMAWCQIADNVFQETVAQMRLDGVL